MTHSRSHASEGFSAVELLITLFIATVFIISGYQLWSQVQTSGAASDQLARASNTSYEYLRRYISQPPSCTASTPLNNSAIPVEGLSNAKITVTITCPYASNPSDQTIKLITATVTYGGIADQESVSHALYVN